MSEKNLDAQAEIRLVQKHYNLTINGEQRGGCIISNDIVIYFEFSLPSDYRIVFRRSDAVLNIYKIYVSRSNYDWHSSNNQKIYERGELYTAKRVIDTIPNAGEVWGKIKEICENAYKYAGDDDAFFKYLYSKYEGGMKK